MKNQEISLRWKRYLAVRDGVPRGSLQCNDLTKNDLTKNDLTRLRNDIADHYQYIVRITIQRMGALQAYGLDSGDFIAEGHCGLLRAIETFKTDMGAKFETYAITLIRGAVLEAIREYQWVPRSVVRKKKPLENFCKSYQSENHGNSPSKSAILDGLGISEDELQTILSLGKTKTVRSLSDTVSTVAEHLVLQDMIEDEGPDIFEQVSASLQSELIKEAQDKLSDREHYVITAYYHQGVSFRKISQTLDISETRVYQLHSQALKNMSYKLRKHISLFTVC